MDRTGLVLVGLLCAGACADWSCARRQNDLSALQSDQLDVRLRAIAHAGRQQDNRALPYLVDCLEDDQADVRLFAILALERITGRTLGYVYYAPAPQRRQAIGRWRDWLHSGRVSDLLASGDAEGPR